MCEKGDGEKKPLSTAAAWNVFSRERLCGKEECVEEEEDGKDVGLIGVGEGGVGSAAASLSLNGLSLYREDHHRRTQARMSRVLYLFRNSVFDYAHIDSATPEFVTEWGQKHTARIIQTAFLPCILPFPSKTMPLPPFPSIKSRL